MAHIVHCRACGGAFDRDLLTENVDWVKPSERQYYHKNCYEQWAKRQGNLTASLTEQEWHEALVYYLNHIVKAPIDFKKLNSQWKNFLKQKKTAKGIYFTVRYFYDITKGDREKSQGGIGIVSMIYQDACSYWEERFKRDSKIIEEIEAQARQQLNQRVNVVKQTKKKTVKKKVISLEEIE